MGLGFGTSHSRRKQPLPSWHLQNIHAGLVRPSLVCPGASCLRRLGEATCGFSPSRPSVLANPFTTSHPNLLGPHLINANAVVPTFAQQSTFWDSQRAVILRALDASGWTVGGLRGAAARLGLKRATLISKMKKLRISRPVSGNQADRGTMRPRNDGHQQLNARASA